MSDLIGKIATVTKAIGNGTAGEVTIVTASGFTRFLAIPATDGAEIAPGTTVFVADHSSPTLVSVSTEYTPK
jgi:uncharacterized protein (DUF1501 family)